MGIIDNAKTVAELVKKYNDLNLYQKIIDLRDEIFELEEENLTLRKKVKELEDQIALKEQLTYEAPYYWRKDGEKKNGPFCQPCYDKDRRLIRLQFRETGRWHCEVCKNSFCDSNYRPPESTPPYRSPMQF